MIRFRTFIYCGRIAVKPYGPDYKIKGLASDHELARSRSPEPEDHLRPEWPTLCTARSLAVHLVSESEQ
jgi:hypothetical protein